MPNEMDRAAAAAAATVSPLSVFGATSVIRVTPPAMADAETSKMHTCTKMTRTLSEVDADDSMATIASGDNSNHSVHSDHSVASSSTPPLLSMLPSVEQYGPQRLCFKKICNKASRFTGKLKQEEAQAEVVAETAAVPPAATFQPISVIKKDDSGVSFLESFWQRHKKKPTTVPTPSIEPKTTPPPCVFTNFFDQQIKKVYKMNPCHGGANSLLKKLLSSEDTADTDVDCQKQPKEQEKEMDEQTKPKAATTTTTKISTTIESIILTQFNQKLAGDNSEAKMLVDHTPMSVQQHQQDNQQILPPPAAAPCAFKNMIESIVSSVFKPTETAPAIASPPKATPEAAAAATLSISEEVYKRLIAFEFNHESILAKFGRDTHTVSNAPYRELNSLETARIDELREVLYPLQYCLSGLSQNRSILKENMNACFSGNITVDVRAQHNTLVSIIKSATTLFINLAKRIGAFAQLTASDQSNLLRHSVLKIMLVRAQFVSQTQKEPDASEAPHLRQYLMSIDTEFDSEVAPIRLEVNDGAASSSVLHAPPTREQTEAQAYADKFCDYMKKSIASMDRAWIEDPTIFYLFFAVLLFRTNRSNLSFTDPAKIKDEFFTYVYLMRRYLEHKFRSYCSAKCHFIRMYGHMEEVNRFHEEVMQKLVDYDVVYSQSLLEKLYIC